MVWCSTAFDRKSKALEYMIPISQIGCQFRSIIFTNPTNTSAMANSSQSKGFWINLARNIVEHKHNPKWVSVCVYIYIYIYICWLIIVETNPKALFSIAITPRCRWGSYSFTWIAPLTLDLHYIMLSVKQGGIKYHFLSLWYDSIRDWTSVSQIIGKHSNHYTNIIFFLSHRVSKL